MRVKLNPSDKLHYSRLLKLLNIQTSSIFSELVNEVIDHFCKEILVLVNSLNEDGVNFNRLIDQFYNNIVESDEIEDNEKNMTLKDLEELKQHWFQYSKKTDNKSIRQFKNAMALGQTHPSTQQIGITLSTVHTMKGQEYDIVFIMGADEGTFPDYRAVNKGGVELIQEKNNIYVAFTRSRRFLYVSFPKQRIMPWGDVKFRVCSRFLKPFFKK